MNSVQISKNIMSDYGNHNKMYILLINHNPQKKENKFSEILP